MTLTLGKSYKADDSERENKVYFVDYFMNRFQNRKIDKALYSILKKYDDCEFYELTHIYKKSSDIKGCFAEAQNVCESQSCYYQTYSLRFTLSCNGYSCYTDYKKV